MYSLGVVEGQILHKLAIEDLRCQKIIHVEVNEFILNGPVESFKMSIHFRRTRVGMVMNHVQSSDLRIEVLLEFRAVVSEDKDERKRKYLKTQFKEFLCCLRCMGCGAPGKGEASIDVLKGDDVSTRAVDMLLNAVKGYTVTRVECFEILWLPRHLDAIDLLDFTEM